MYYSVLLLCSPSHLLGPLAVMEEVASPTFPFPYQPYHIQDQFMQALYRALEHGKVGIFESPTGTVCASDQMLNTMTSQWVSLGVCLH